MYARRELSYIDKMANKTDMTTAFLDLTDIGGNQSADKKLQCSVINGMGGIVGYSVSM